MRSATFALLAFALTLPTAALAQSDGDADVTIVKPQEGATVIINGDDTSEVELPATNLEGDDAEAGVTVRMVDPGEGDPVPGQVFTQDPNTFFVTTMIDADVRNHEGEHVGEIQNVLMGTDAQISAIVLEVGGFLGIGEKSVALAATRFAIERDEEGGFVFVVDADDDELDDAPEFLTVEEVEEAAEEAQEEAAEEAAEAR